MNWKENIFPIMGSLLDLQFVDVETATLIFSGLKILKVGNLSA